MVIRYLNISKILNGDLVGTFNIKIKTKFYSDHSKFLSILMLIMKNLINIINQSKPSYIINVGIIKPKINKKFFDAFI